MKKLIYLLLALPLLAAKCEKDPPVVVNKPVKPVVTDSSQVDSALTELEKLPPITTTGANTFGCLLNGKAWLPNSGGTSNPKLVVDYFNHKFLLRGIIYGSTVENNTRVRSLIQVNVSELFNTGIINLNNGFIFHQDVAKNCEYVRENNLSGKVEISRFDTIQRIISGQFDFSLYIDDACDTVNITNGRFDVKY